MSAKRRFTISVRFLIVTCVGCGITFGIIGRMALSVRMQRDLLRRLDIANIRACVKDSRASAFRRVNAGDVSFVREFRFRVAYLSCRSSVEPLELLTVISEFPNLESLEVQASSLSTEDIRRLAALSKLKTLRLCRTHVPRDGIAALSGAAKLEELELIGSEFSEESVNRLDCLKGLRTLRLFDTSITAGVTATLRRCASLEQFEVHRGADEGDSWLHSLASVQQLKCIYVEKAVTDTGAEAIPQFADLRDLKLSDASRLSECGMRAIARCRALTRLTLWRGRPTAEMMKAIAQMDRLEFLDIESVGVDVAIDDKMVSQLTPMKALRALSLRNSRISDTGLQILGNVPSLKEIVAGQFISIQGVEALKRKRPDIHVLIVR